MNHGPKEFVRKPFDRLRHVLIMALAVSTIFLLTPTTSFAALITFIHTGTGSGTIGTTAFLPSAFTITAVGDTANRQSFSGGFYIDHTSASITIAGVGSFTLTSPTRTFFNDNIDLVGFSRGGGGGTDLYNGPSNAVFNGWDMLSSIGPANGNTNLLQWLSPSVNTSGGVLIFNNASTQGSFQAIVDVAAVPEPATLTLFGMMAVGGALYGWRRRQAAAA